jgi:uncharacterized protein YndB with AHSA1/START domain
MTPATLELDFERDFEFPPSIVFDALIEPDLIAGWLAAADVEPQLDGCYDLVWLTSSSYPPTEGVITALEEPDLLEIETDNRGEISFSLSAMPGGPFGTSTRLVTRVRVAVDSAFVPRVKADWQSNLDQLDGLLRGHPVDWANWDRDRAEAWRGYLAAAGGR